MFAHPLRVVMMEIGLFGAFLKSLFQACRKFWPRAAASASEGRTLEVTSAAFQPSFGSLVSINRPTSTRPP